MLLFCVMIVIHLCSGYRWYAVLFLLSSRHYFTEGVVRPWHRLSKAEVESSSLEAVKNFLVVAPEDMG